jgi:Flp pilus assembly protein TadG
MGCRRSQRGSAMVEFTLAGIASMFLMISTVEMSRGMWNYHTLAYAVREAARYATFHGKGCTNAGNSCTVTVGNIATQIANAAIGVDVSQLNVTLTTSSGASTNCNPLNTCYADATVWPPATNNDNAPGGSITISAKYSFQTALAMFWPGATPPTFGAIYFPASSTQIIMY